MWTHGESRSSLSVADRETAGLTEFYEHGAVAPDAAWVELTHAVTQRWEPGSWLTISGSLPRGAPDEGYRDLIQRRAAVASVSRSTPRESGCDWRSPPSRRS